SVQLSSDLVARIGDISTAPGGLLLGRTETSDGFTTLHIDDVKAVGGFPPVSEPLGIVRVLSKSGPLQLHQEDADLFRQRLCEGGRLFMLIQPPTGRAAFFLPKWGVLEAEQIPDHAFALPGLAAPPPKRTGRKAVIAAAAVLAGAAGGAALVYLQDGHALAE